MFVKAHLTRTFHISGSLTMSLSKPKATGNGWRNYQDHVQVSWVKTPNGKVFVNTTSDKIPFCHFCADHGHDEEVCDRCARCGERGHTPKDCPKECPKELWCIYCKDNGKFNGIWIIPHIVWNCPRIHCRNCKEAGHVDQHCGNDEAEFSCLACGGFSHTEENCWKKLCGNCDADWHKTKNCRQCYNCQAWGHTTSKANPCQVIFCKTCEDVGHYSNECPNFCTKCRDVTGHTYLDCPDIRCTICEKFGHHAHGCTDPVAEYVVQ